MVKRLSVLIALLAAFVLAACEVGPGDATNDNAAGNTNANANDNALENANANDNAGDTITLCHATGSETNPYEEITVSRNAMEGHDQHPDDIIPAPLEGCPEVAAPEPTGEAACRPGENTALAWLEGDDRFEGFVEALEEVGAADALDGDGDFTVFAPLDRDLAERRGDDDAWESLVLYHIVEQELMSDELEDLDSVTAMNDETITITADNGDIVLNRDAEIVEPDNRACNGVIHVIDDALTPPGAGADNDNDNDNADNDNDDNDNDDNDNDDNDNGDNDNDNDDNDND